MTLDATKHQGLVDLANDEPPAGIVWHQHPDQRWVWGVYANDGCALCDAAQRWLDRPVDAEPVPARSVREAKARPTVYTARLSRGLGKWLVRTETETAIPDTAIVNVTRQSGLAEFAPSWSLLRQFLPMRTDGTLTDEDWKVYARSYTVEMHLSYRCSRGAWDALLEKPVVVLACYCPDAARCHRTLLAGLLGRLGADVRGELVAGVCAAPGEQLGVFG